MQPLVFKNVERVESGTEVDELDELDGDTNAEHRVIKLACHDSIVVGKYSMRPMYSDGIDFGPAAEDDCNDSTMDSATPLPDVEEPWLDK